MRRAGTTVSVMPGRAEQMIERRRRESEERREQRRHRRLLVRDLLLVAGLTVPTILCHASDDHRPHAHPDAPGETAAMPDPSAIPVPVPASGHPPAPAGLRVLARRHGGTSASPWVAPECEHILPLLVAHDLPVWMATVAWRESRCQPERTNLSERTRDASYGLFQINTRGRLAVEARERCGIDRAEELLDAQRNVACAAALHRAYGYRPWDSGRYFDS